MFFLCPFLFSLFHISTVKLKSYLGCQMVIFTPSMMEAVAPQVNENPGFDHHANDIDEPNQGNVT